jgi:hypothetical protein
MAAVSLLVCRWFNSALILLRFTPEFLAYDLPQRFHAVKRLAKARNQSSEPTVAVMKSSFRLSVSQISLSIAWRVSLPPKIAQPNFNCQKFPSSPSQLLILNNR